MSVAAVIILNNRIQNTVTLTLGINNVLKLPFFIKPEELFPLTCLSVIYLVFGILKMDRSLKFGILEEE